MVRLIFTSTAPFFITTQNPRVPAVDGAGAAPTVKRPNVQMPDEYLPPNKILFLQNLPESVTKDQLMNLFSQCVFVPLLPIYTRQAKHEDPA